MISNLGDLLTGLSCELRDHVARQLVGLGDPLLLRVTVDQSLSFIEQQLSFTSLRWRW